jgi:hypothetical protein
MAFLLQHDFTDCAIRLQTRECLWMHAKCTQRGGVEHILVALLCLRRAVDVFLQHTSDAVHALRIMDSFVITEVQVHECGVATCKNIF